MENSNLQNHKFTVTHENLTLIFMESIMHRCWYNERREGVGRKGRWMDEKKEGKDGEEREWRGRREGGYPGIWALAQSAFISVK